VVAVSFAPDDGLDRAPVYGALREIRRTHTFSPAAYCRAIATMNRSSAPIM